MKINILTLSFIFLSINLFAQRINKSDKSDQEKKVKEIASPNAPDKNAEFEFERYLYLSLKKYPLFMYEEDSVKAENLILSDLSRETIDNMAQKGCNCLKDNKILIENTLSELNNLFKKAEETDSILEKKVFSKPFRKLMPFLDCFDTVLFFESDSSRVAVNTDLLKLTGDSDDDESVRIKQLELIYFYFGKNCPDDRNLFLSFINTNKRIKDFIK